MCHCGKTDALSGCVEGNYIRDLPFSVSTLNAAHLLQRKKQILFLRQIVEEGILQPGDLDSLFNLLGTPPGSLSDR